ncbi:MAG: germination protein YpeB, partial [Clostridia bacterium]|nr:germination protein YpeB [Clostridia bacterium]
MQKENLRKKVRIISFLCALCVTLGAFAAVNAKKAKAYSRQLETARQRSLMSLTESLDSITASLLKSEYGYSGDMMKKLSMEMGRNAAQAKSVLSALDCPEDGSQGIYRFLSQVGAYTTAVSDNINMEKTGKDLTALYTYSKNLSDGVENICRKYYDGEMSFEQTVSTLSMAGDEKSWFSKELYDAEQTFTDYPVLIYDGPFSEAAEQRTPAALEGKKLITEETAREKAAKILNSGTVTKESDEEGTMELFCFSAGGKTAGITKYGGKLCYIISSGYAAQAEIDEKEAVKKGGEYLNSIGYKNMKSTYYSVYDGICTVNYAYEKNGIMYYPDLIKVSISLETGDICELDARGFLMNHAA